MTFDIIAYPWLLFKQCCDENILGDFNAELTNSLNEMELVGFANYVGDSYMYFHQVYNETSVAGRLSFEGKNQFIEFCNSLIHEEPASDLDAGAQDEITVAVVSSERLDHLAGLIPTFSIDSWKEAYKQFLADNGSNAAEIEAVDESAEYVSKLCEFVLSVAGKGNCLAIQVC